MSLRIFSSLAAFGFMAVWTLLPVTVSAATLLDASTLWKFDFASSGTATNTQIIDSSALAPTATVSATNFNALSWTTVPATGPAGGAAVDTIGNGLQFTPVVTVPAAGTGTTEADTVRAAAFIAGNANVTGSAAIVMRLRWDGRPAGLDDNIGSQWLVNNGYTGLGNGFLFGINSTDLLTGRLSVLTNGAGATNPNSSSTFTLQTGVWYDIALVFDDLGDADIATGRLSFYIQSAAGGFQSTVINNAYIPTGTGNTNLVVGSETAGTGSGNNRKSFYGAMDYLALFDTSLTQSEVQAIFAAPEPGRALLLMMGVMLIGIRRRRVLR